MTDVECEMTTGRGDTTGVPRRTTLTLERNRLYEQIATLTAGNPAGDVYAALADNLWQVAALLAGTPEAAEKLLRDTIPDMMRDMRANWPLVVEAQAQMRKISNA
jgi:hypothetical protein